MSLAVKTIIDIAADQAKYGFSTAPERVMIGAEGRLAKDWFDAYMAGDFVKADEIMAERQKLKQIRIT